MRKIIALFRAAIILIGGSKKIPTTPPEKIEDYFSITSPISSNPASLIFTKDTNQISNRFITVKVSDEYYVHNYSVNNQTLKFYGVKHQVEFYRYLKRCVSSI